jgi:hypothetical protein
MAKWNKINKTFYKNFFFLEKEDLFEIDSSSEEFVDELLLNAFGDFDESTTSIIADDFPYFEIDGEESATASKGSRVPKGGE